MTGTSEITRELAQARFTAEMRAEMCAPIGTGFRTDAGVNNEDADVDAAGHPSLR